ncbi:MAG: hypothetical protein KDD02_20035 [Phaeodactylibacter sp.]|nr:hypothetical protein [Phaeodactylibacter sp.]
MKQIYTFLFIITAFGGLQAQDEKLPYYFQLNGNFQAGIPIEAFGDRLDKAGLGGGGLLLFQLGRGNPLFVGLEGSYLRYDTEKLDFDLLEDGVLNDYRLHTNNNILLGHALIRFKPFTGFFIQPYFDGLIGFKKFYTRTRFIDLMSGEDEVVEADTDQSDSAFSYGGAAGLQIRVSTFPDILIDLRCAYLPGATATYLVRKADNSGPFEDPIDAFEEAASPTTLLMPQIGVTIQLSNRDFQTTETGGEQR